MLNSTSFAGGKEKEALLLLFKGDGVEESRTNIEKVLCLLQFPIKIDGVIIKIAADLKLTSMLVGLNGTQCRHCCIFCQVVYIFTFCDKIWSICHKLKTCWMFYLFGGQFFHR